MLSPLCLASEATSLFALPDLVLRINAAMHAPRAVPRSGGTPNWGPP